MIRRGALGRAVAWLSLTDRPTAIAMGLVCLYYAFSWGPWQGKASGDGWFGFLYLKTIFYYHTLDMRFAAPEFLKFFGESGPGHHMPNRCPFGPVLLWLPLYALVAIPEALLLHWKVLPHAAWNGQSPVHIWVTGLATLAAVLVGWRATLKLLLRHLPLPSARLGAAATVLATPLLWYTCHQPFYQHGIAFLCIAVFFEYWERTYGERSVRRFVWCGLVLGYAASVRAQEIVYVLPLAVELVLGMLRGPRRARHLRGALVAAAAFLVAFSPQIFVWLYYNGKVAPVQAEPIRWREPWPLVVLFSSRAGLFFWSPIAYVGVAGALRAALLRDKLGRLTRQFGAAFLVGFYVVCCAWVVAGAYAFGARRLSDAMGLVGLGVAVTHAGLTRERARRLLVGFVGFCVVLNVALMSILLSRKMSSPGSSARSLAGELQTKVRAPAWVVGAAARLGWPFSEPAGAAWALYHRVPIATFETVVGELMMERDGQWLTLIQHSLELGRAMRFHVAEGLTWDVDSQARVVGAVRVPFDMFATEPVQADVVGTIGDGPIRVTWNGAVVKAERTKGALRLPRLDARAGYDELVLELPLGSTLQHIDFAVLQALRRPTFP